MYLVLKVCVLLNLDQRIESNIECAEQIPELKTHRTFHCSFKYKCSSRVNIILILHKCTSCRQSIYPSNHIKDSWQGLHKVLENIFNQTVAQLLEAQTHLRNSISLVCSTFLRTKLILINTEWTTNPNKTIPQQVTYNEWHSYLPFSPNLLFQEVHTHVQET